MYSVNSKQVLQHTDKTADAISNSAASKSKSQKRMPSVKTNGVVGYAFSQNKHIQNYELYSAHE